MNKNNKKPAGPLTSMELADRVYAAAIEVTALARLLKANGPLTADMAAMVKKASLILDNVGTALVAEHPTEIEDME